MYLSVLRLLDQREQDIIHCFFNRIPKHSLPNEAENQTPSGKSVKRSRPPSVTIELISDQMDELRRAILRRIMDITFVEFNRLISPNVFYRLCYQDEHYSIALFQINPDACLKVKVKNTVDFILLSNQVLLSRFKNMKNKIKVSSGQAVRFTHNRTYFLYNEDVDSTYFLYVARLNLEPFNNQLSLF